MRIINEPLLWQQVLFKVREIFETKLNLNQERFDTCYEQVKKKVFTPNTGEQFKFFCDCVGYDYSKNSELITLGFDNLEKFCEHLIHTFHKSWLTSGFGAEFLAIAFLSILESPQLEDLGTNLLELNNRLYIWMRAELTNEKRTTQVHILIGINNLNWL